MTDQEHATKSLKVSETHDGEISDGPGSAARKAHAHKRSFLQQIERTVSAPDPDHSLKQLQVNHNAQSQKTLGSNIEHSAAKPPAKSVTESHKRRASAAPSQLSKRDVDSERIAEKYLNDKIESNNVLIKKLSKNSASRSILYDQSVQDRSNGSHQHSSQSIARKVQKQMNIINLLMTAKAKFKNLLVNKYIREEKAAAKYATAAQMDDMKHKQYMKECLKVIDKCPTLNGLHPVIKSSLVPKMEFIYLKKGDKYKFKNFPKLFLLMSEGRLGVQWFKTNEIELAEDNYEKETLFIRDYLDAERLARLYANKAIVNHEAVCLSERATVVEVSTDAYEKHYRYNEQFNRMNINQLIWKHTPLLSDYGVGFKIKISSKFQAIHCCKGQVLEVEGQLAKNAYILIKGEIGIYKKIFDDNLRDTNSRRKEKRSLKMGQNQSAPTQEDKRLIVENQESILQQIQITENVLAHGELKKEEYKQEQDKLQNLHVLLQQADEAFQKVYNHVGVKLEDNKPEHVYNPDQRQLLLGEKVGSAAMNQYIAEDSVVLKQPLTYSIASESNDTFVLQIKRHAVNMDYPVLVLEAMTEACLKRDEKIGQSVMKAVTRSSPKEEAALQVQLQIKQHNKKNFPFVNRCTQQKMVNLLLKDHCEGVQDIFFSRKNYQHDFQTQEEKQHGDLNILSYQEKKKMGIQLKHNKIEDRKLLGHLEDADIDRLLSIKNNIFQTFNYKNHNKHLKANYTGPEDTDFGYWKQQDFKDQLHANEHRNYEQRSMIADNTITTELNLPSIQGLVKDFTASKNSIDDYFDLKNSRFKDITNEKQFQINTEQKSFRPLYKDMLIKYHQLEQQNTLHREGPDEAPKAKLLVSMLSDKSQQLVSSLRGRRNTTLATYNTSSDATEQPAQQLYSTASVRLPQLQYPRGKLGHPPSVPSQYLLNTQLNSPIRSDDWLIKESAQINQDSANNLNHFQHEGRSTNFTNRSKSVFKNSGSMMSPVMKADVLRRQNVQKGPVLMSTGRRGTRKDSKQEK